MESQIFERFEKKYLLREDVCRALCRKLASRMDEDRFGRYSISSIYYDTADCELIRRSIEKTAYKEKLRLRSYGPAGENDTVYAELKKKYAGVVYKRRIALPLHSAKRLLAQQDASVLTPEQAQIGAELTYAVTRYGLMPRVFISYDRTALSGKEDPELRVTFDRNIRCRHRDLSLNRSPADTFLLEPDQMLMEVKIPGAMPVWISRIFSELGIRPVSYSKYGAYYKNYLCRELFPSGRACQETDGQMNERRQACA